MAAVPGREALAEGPHPLLELERGPHRAERVIGRLEGHVVERHDRVADVLVDGAPVLEHRLGHHGQVLAQEGDDLFRLHLLRHGREAADVGEEHGHATPGGGQLAVVLVPDDLGHHVRREEAREAALLPLLLGEVLGHRARVGDEQRQRHRHHLDPVAGPQEGGVAGREVAANRGGHDPEGGQGTQRGGGPRGARGREHRHHRHEQRRDPAQGNALQQGLQGMGVDLHARHPGLRGERGGEDIVQRGRGRAHQDDLPREDLGRDLAGQHAMVGHHRERAGAAAIVDEELVPRGGGGPGQPGLLGEAVDQHVEAEPVAVLEIAAEGGPADERVRVRIVVGRAEGGLAADLRDRRVQRLLHEGGVADGGERGGQDDAIPDSIDRGPERDIVGRAVQRGLGEQDIQADRGRVPAPDQVEELGVHRAGPGPGEVQPVEIVLVDGDDHDGRRGGLRAADRELGVQGLQLGDLEEAQGVDGGQHHHGQAGQASGEEHAPGGGEGSHRRQA